MKRILISLSIIGVVATIAIGVTVALFNDTETSTGNIFIAGDLDLKVDHLAQTYNDADCKTCSVILISDLTNMVVAKNDVPFPIPYSAVWAWTHSAWTAQNDPALSAAGAKWIWEANPTKQEDTTANVTYTFEKTFEWWGPITSSDLSMAVGHDNTVEVYLNNVLIGFSNDIYGFQIEHMLHIPSASIISNVLQGQNVLKIKISNKGQTNGTPYNNPAGLIYKFEINGLCGSDYFKTHCTLWGLKDLASGDTFWNFTDVKAGDHGTNLISLHIYNNDAYACLITHNIIDLENVITDPEAKAGDITNPLGELSGSIKIFAWEDDGDGNYEVGEPIITGPNAAITTAIGRISLIASNTKNIGVAWCVGTQSLNGNNIVCDGSSTSNLAQTDIMNAYISAYAEQQRNNSGFVCPDLDQPR